MKSRPRTRRHFTDIMQLSVFFLNHSPWQDYICNTPPNRVTVPHQTALREQLSQHGILGHIVQVAVMLQNCMRALSILHIHFEKCSPQITYFLPYNYELLHSYHLPVTWHLFPTYARYTVIKNVQEHAHRGSSLRMKHMVIFHTFGTFTECYHVQSWPQLSLYHIPTFSVSLQFDFPQPYRFMTSNAIHSTSRKSG